MKYIKFIFFVVLMTMYSCSNTRVNDNELQISDTIRSIIERYISEHPQYNTFMLRQSDEDIFCDTYFPRGIILGPGYRDILEKKKRRLFIDIDTVRIYIDSYITDMLNYDNTGWVNVKPEDSIVVYKNRVDIDPWVNYIYRAIFIYRDDDEIKVNTRPDTIFVPKRVESKIKFVPVAAR